MRVLPTGCNTQDQYSLLTVGSGMRLMCAIKDTWQLKTSDTGKIEIYFGKRNKIDTMF